MNCQWDIRHIYLTFIYIIYDTVVVVHAQFDEQIPECF